MVARLTRLLPIFVIIALASVAAYFVLSWITSPNRAKDILTKVFFVLCSVFSGFFILAALYAALEQNWVAAEFVLTFLVPGLIGLIVTILCRRAFLKHHPSFGTSPLQAEIINPKPWCHIIDSILRLFGYTRTK